LSNARVTARTYRGSSVGLCPDRGAYALVAHDNKKVDLLEWARFNRDTLASNDLVATCTTGTLLEGELSLDIHKLLSGPLGGDQQIGAMISQRQLDLLVFFWDPLEPQPHDPDVKALLRTTVVWNVPVACNRATADFMIACPLMDGTYEREIPEHSAPLVV
jgi:methylglyoxal synthase